eukprot:12089839-Alexandrium_andersonii.AAC.1
MAPPSTSRLGSRTASRRLTWPSAGTWIGLRCRRCGSVLTKSEAATPRPPGCARVPLTVAPV